MSVVILMLFCPPNMQRRYVQLSFYSGFIVISVCMCFFAVFFVFSFFFFFFFFSCVLLYEFDIK